MNWIERRRFGIAAVVGAVAVAGLYGHVPRWGVAIAVLALAGLIAVPVRGRAPLAWLSAAVRYRVGRRRRAGARSAGGSRVGEVDVAAGSCGIRRDGPTYVSMIQLAPDLDLPTVVGESSAYTADTVPVPLLIGLLDQYGLFIDIDIVTTGRRLRETGNYGLLYDQLIGSHPVVGDRLSWLVVRLNAERNRELLARRGPCAVVAPSALASATHRIAARLRERGVAAQTLPSSALREAMSLLCAGFDLDDIQERWGTMLSGENSDRVTSYAVDPADLTDDDHQSLWAPHDGRTTMTVSLGLRRGDRSPSRLPWLLDTRLPSPQVAEMRAVVRYVGHRVRKHSAVRLHSIPGRQSDALCASLPIGAGCAERELGIPAAADSLAAALRIPIGPSGQILGAISGRARHTLAVPLYDPTNYQPRRRMVEVHAALPIAQQITLRAVVVGANVEVHTSRPERWRQLLAAVGDGNALRIADYLGPDAGEHAEASKPAAPLTVAVFDRLVPMTTAARTTIRVSEPGTPAHAAAHLVIDQVDESAVAVRLPMGTVRLDLIEPTGESRYLDTNSDPVVGHAESGGQLFTGQHADVKVGE